MGPRFPLQCAVAECSVRNVSKRARIFDSIRAPRMARAVADKDVKGDGRNAFMVCSLAGLACPVHTGRGFLQRGRRLRRRRRLARSSRRQRASMHAPTSCPPGTRLATPRSANPAQTGALIRMFYLTRYVSLFVRFGVLDGTVTR